MTTIAGGNGPGLRDGPAATAQFEGPTDVAIAHDGAIYVADSPAHRIRKITPDGMVTTVAGGGPTARSRSSEGIWGSFRDGPADEARFAYPHRIAFGPYGDLFIIEWNKRIRRLSPSGTVVTFAGTGTPGYEDGPRQQAEFFNLLAIDVDLAGNVYVIDNSPTIKTGLVPTIRKIDTAGVVSTLYRDVPLTRGGTLATPIGLAVARDGAIYIANTGRHQIVELTRDGELRAVAGTGEQGYIDGPRDQAMFSLPGAIAVSDDGTLVVADEGNNVIRTIDLSAGVLSSHALALAGAEQIPRLQGVEVTIFAGRPGPKFAGVPRFMDGPAESTLFYRPWGMALDAEGNVIVADSGNDAIRRIAPDGTVTTVAGGSGRGLLDAPGADAQFSQPKGVAVHPDGSIYVADSGNNRIRRIAPDGSVTTVAGSGPPAIEGNRGDFRNGPASEARFRDPSALAFDEAGNLLISDTENNRIRSLSPDGEVSTVAGGSPPPAPDSGVGNPGSRDGPGPHAYVGLPGGIAVDDEGNIFFTESNNAIRMIDGSGYVSTVLRTPQSRHGGALSPFIDGIAVGTRRCAVRGGRALPDVRACCQDHARGRAIDRLRQRIHQPSRDHRHRRWRVPRVRPRRERDLEDHRAERPMSTVPHIRERAIARLRAALTYWIATTRPDGRPHSMPVWGVWVDDALWFGTDGQKARNLAHEPYAVAHVESAEDVAIVEGPVERLPIAETPAAVSAAYRDKYVDPESGEPFVLVSVGDYDPKAALYVLRPQIGHAWVEGAFVETQTRWTFEAGS